MGKAKVMKRNEKGVMEEVAIEPQIMTEEVAALIGAQSEAIIYEVERGAIRSYARAVGDPNPLYNDAEYARNSQHGELICPPGFFGWPIKSPAYQSSLFSQVRETAGRRTAMDNGGEVEFLLPVRAGDTLTVVNKNADIYEEVGRSGNRLLLVISETTYTNQNGDVVARDRHRVMLV